MALLRISTLIAVLAFSGSAAADTLRMTGIAPDDPSARPVRGMSEGNVQSRYGLPVNKIAAVGEPPISRWEYADYVVYFEHDRVIHAVVKR